MKTQDLICWKCGTSLKEVLLPMSRLSKCKSCNVDLHVCRMCEYYDTTVNNSCREPIAEKVTDKTRKNFCGYFLPGVMTQQVDGSSQVTSSKQQLDALFGLDSVGKDNPEISAEDQARKDLEELFNPGVSKE